MKEIEEVVLYIVYNLLIITIPYIPSFHFSQPMYLYIHLHLELQYDLQMDKQDKATQNVYHRS